MVAAIPTATAFLFQMATLGGFYKCLLLGEDRITEGQKTYMRSTSKNDAAARARYAKT
jgi:hypothetical protein